MKKFDHTSAMKIENWKLVMKKLLKEIDERTYTNYKNYLC